MNNLPLSMTLENARAQFFSAFNKALAETKLPAYLVEGIMFEILADLRARKNIELMQDFNSIKTEEKEPKT